MDKFRMKKIIILFVLSQLINCNNIIQMNYLAGKDLIDGYAVWESSSTILLCFYFLFLCGYTMAGKGCLGTYMSKNKIIIFYGDIIIKFTSAILAVLYITILYKSNYKFVYYTLQGIIITVDIIINIYLLKSFKYINDSNKKLLKKYGNKYKSIKCNEYEKEKVADVYAFSIILLIFNFSYNFFLPMTQVIILASVLFLINLFMLYFYNSKLKNILNKIPTLKKKYIDRGNIGFIICNIANLIVCFIDVDIVRKAIFLFIYDFIFSVYMYIVMIKHIENTLKGMEYYLEQSNGNQ